MDNPRGRGGGQVKASPRQQRATLTKSSSHAQMRASEPPAARRKSQTDGRLPFLLTGASSRAIQSDHTVGTVCQ
eukprot:3615963-Rhodomonas_salina.1